jgi:hypothetical protein
MPPARKAHERLDSVPARGVTAGLRARRIIARARHSGRESESVCQCYRTCMNGIDVHKCPSAQDDGPAVCACADIGALGFFCRREGAIRCSADCAVR